MCLFVKDVGIDLGTANTLIYIKNKGIVLNEPSVIAVDYYTNNLLSTGQEAKEMIGKTPGNIIVVRPLKDGVISDFEMTARMLKAYIKSVVPEPSFFTRIRVVVGVPSGITEVEKRAVEEVVRETGAKEVYIMEEPLAAAIGSGLAVDSSMGCMVVDIGGGTSDIAIISLGGIVTNTSLRYAGDKQNDAIIAYMRKQYDLLIGEKTAEEIKKGIGCAYIDKDDSESIRQMQVRGRDVISGLPKTITITSLDILDALEDSIKIIIDGIRKTLEEAPPEIAADIISNGLVLSGGGALIQGMDKLIEISTGLNVIISENALEAVAEGTGKSLASIERVQKYSWKGSKKKV